MQFMIQSPNPHYPDQIDKKFHIGTSKIECKEYLQIVLADSIGYLPRKLLIDLPNKQSSECFLSYDSEEDLLVANLIAPYISWKDFKVVTIYFNDQFAAKIPMKFLSEENSYDDLLLVLSLLDKDIALTCEESYDVHLGTKQDVQNSQLIQKGKFMIYEENICDLIKVQRLGFIDYYLSFTGVKYY